MQGTTKRVRVSATAVPDRHEDKFFPTGISATIVAISSRWSHVQNGGRDNLSVPEFLRITKFTEVLRYVNDIYKRRRNPVNTESESSVKQYIYKLVNQKRSADFADLRIFAEFVGLPTGLLLLFTQFVSDENRMRNKEEFRIHALNFVKKLRNLIDDVERRLEQSTDDYKFINVYSEDKYSANVCELKKWADAYTVGNHDLA